MAGILGPSMVIIGIFWGIKLFNLIFGVLRSPQELTTYVDRLSVVLGGNELGITIQGEPPNLSRTITTVLLGLGATVLVWTAMGFINLGVRSVTWL